MRKHNIVRRLVAIVLSATMIFGSALAVSAAELEEPVDQIEASALEVDSAISNTVDPKKGMLKGAGSAIAFGSGTVYASGSINVYMTSGNAFADIKVGSDRSDDAGSLSCSVRFPNGTSYNLGDILASGGSSNARQFTWCPAGTYTFYFYGSRDVAHSVWATIYD